MNNLTKKDFTQEEITLVKQVYDLFLESNPRSEHEKLEPWIQWHNLSNYKTLFENQDIDLTDKEIFVKYCEYILAIARRGYDDGL